MSSDPHSAETLVSEMSFEEALAALETVVGRLEDGKVPLEASIALYQRGAELKSRCEALLRDAELKVSRIVAGADGGPALAPEAEASGPAAERPARKPAAAKPKPKPRPDPAASGAADEDDIPF
ncbi:hypothetical protein LNKW23_17130 [Paralimibaculum aggregatum]|uniref:Exodeoxyribonuclease 7 small subunit n=1 Tax=Paralimibaculum aggregatum TaxID=3036245 RepID=A0ABQ6LGT1_9RHOB|nr:hypothetical protein LNKW23_17130 [Limibaculum sp. NKW23]